MVRRASQTRAAGSGGKPDVSTRSPRDANSDASSSSTRAAQDAYAPKTASSIRIPRHASSPLFSQRLSRKAPLFSDSATSTETPSPTALVEAIALLFRQLASLPLEVIITDAAGAQREPDALHAESLALKERVQSLSADEGMREISTFSRSALSSLRIAIALTSEREGGDQAVLMGIFSQDDARQEEGSSRLAIADILTAAEQEGWSAEKTRKMLQLRILIHQALQQRNLAPEKAWNPVAMTMVAAPLWKGSKASLIKAASEYQLLRAFEQAQVRYDRAWNHMHTLSRHLETAPSETRTPKRSPDLSKEPPVPPITAHPQGRDAPQQEATPAAGELQAKRARLARTLLEHPELGMLKVTSSVNGTEFFYVHFERAGQWLQNMQNNLQRGKPQTRAIAFSAFDPVEGVWQEIDLTDRGFGEADIDITLSDRPLGNQPKAWGMLRLLTNIYEKRAYQELARIMQWAESSAPQLHQLINDLLLPLSGMQASPALSTQLAHVQHISRTAFHLFTEEDASMPELTHITPDRMTAWIRTQEKTLGGRSKVVTANLASLLERISASPSLRRALSQMMLLHTWSTGHSQLDQRNLLVERKALESLQYLLSWASHERHQTLPQSGESHEKLENLADMINSLYVQYRPHLLLEPMALKRATGMHAPWHWLPTTKPDSSLGKHFPETRRIEAAHRWQLFEALRSNRTQLSPDMKHLIEYFPEFANVFLIIGITTQLRLLSDEVVHDINATSRALRTNYEQGQHALQDEEVLEASRQALRNLYARHADAIRGALAQRDEGGKSVAQFLTGMDAPWESEGKGSSAKHGGGGRRDGGVAPRGSASSGSMPGPVHRSPDLASTRHHATIGSGMMVAHMHPPIAMSFAHSTLQLFGMHLNGVL